MDQNKREDMKYLELLAEKFPTIQDVCTEIINLKAILNLPKGTEHFLSDLHGEYESFLHILKNASGVIKAKIEETLGDTMLEEDRRKLATLIYYPEEKLEMIKKEEKDMKEYYLVTLYRLIAICRVVASKYSRSKVRKAMPKGYEYIIDELLQADQSSENREYYYHQIIDSMIQLDRADAFIIAISKLIQQLSVDRLHIIGDIYDRGPGPHIIMDKLMEYHSVDIQWGNHDMIWMGAACGSAACIFNVIRMCTRYDNLSILEDGYGINVRMLTEFAVEMYANDKLDQFKPKDIVKMKNPLNIDILSKTQKAAAIIQFKLEGQIIKRHPEYEMEDRLLLEKVDYNRGKVTIKGKEYPMLDTSFPTIDPTDPYRLTKEEEAVVEKLVACFQNSEKLQKHVNFMYAKGSVYKIYNNNLLIHGCVPMDEEGNFVKAIVNGKKISGKEYLDSIDKVSRKAYFGDKNTREKEEAKDFVWYLWCGKNSPIFCKDAMTTFEKYFVEDEQTWEEHKNPFYQFSKQEKCCEKIMKEFEMQEETGHIICGHIPVKFIKGESPIKAGGKLIVIDGGLSKAYQKTTGIAGYTLIYNSYGFILAAHEPFASTRQAITQETDLHSTRQMVEKIERKRIQDTDIGLELNQQIEDLKQVLKAYKEGDIKQKK